VDELLQAGASVNRQAGSKTALSVAAGQGRAEIVNMLLKAGAEVNYKSKIELSPLASAAAGGHLEILQILLQAGADLNLVGWLGWTAVMALSSAALRNVRGVQMLLAAGADPDKKGNEVATEFESVLLHMHVVPANDFVLLLKAAKSGYAEIVSERKTAIKMAARPDRYGGIDAEIMFALIEGGADLDDATSPPDPIDLNAQDARGNTVLIVAASLGSQVAVERLLARKVDVNKKNLEGNSAIMLAQANGHRGIVEMLQQAGASA
jgi:ankyrin repeat protein